MHGNGFALHRAAQAPGGNRRKTVFPERSRLNNYILFLFHIKVHQFYDCPLTPGFLNKRGDIRRKAGASAVRVEIPDARSQKPAVINRLGRAHRDLLKPLRNDRIIDVESVPADSVYIPRIGPYVFDPAHHLPVVGLQNLKGPVGIVARIIGKARVFGGIVIVPVSNHRFKSP